MDSIVTIYGSAMVFQGGFSIKPPWDWTSSVEIAWNIVKSYGLVLVLSNENHIEAINTKFLFISSTYFLFDKTRTGPYGVYDIPTLDA